MKNSISAFLSYAISREQIRSVLGGSNCGCHQAAPYNCEILARENPGSPGFDSCVASTYLECCQIDPTCSCWIP